jgi:hypothetical protein
MNVSGHSFIANRSWMDGDAGYDTLEACQEDIGRQQAFHPAVVLTGPNV